MNRAVVMLVIVLIATSRGAAWPPPESDAASLARVRAYERARIAVIERVSPAVACLFNSGSRAGGGSGVIIDEDGYGLTNFHVVAGMLEDRAGQAGLPDGRLGDIDVLGIDPTGDVAMFRLHGRPPFPAVPLGDSDALDIGDYTLALGNPFLLAEDFTPTVTLGIISGLHRYQAGAGKKGRALRYTDCIQVDTSINPGNSGGPLFDLSGRLVGINGRVSIEERGRVNVGVGYAITINQIKRFIPMLRAGLAAKHATAGFTTTDRRGAVVVDQILDDAPAYLAGLRLGDHILRFGGRAITSANQFKSILDVYPAGWTVEVVFRRPPAADEKNGAAAHPQESRRIRFRLGDLPFPEMSGGHGGMFGAKNPFGPHPVTRAANRRAVRRALERYHHALGGAAAVARLKTIRMTGRRVLARAPAAPPTPIHSTETRASALTPANGRTPVAIERAIRWMLLAPAEKAARDRYRVVGADEVRRRIAVLIKRKATEGCPDFRLAFDDADGRLLSMEFTDPMTGKRARYEYDDYRRAGGLKLPHLRRLYLDDAPYATDRFERITASG